MTGFKASTVHLILCLFISVPFLATASTTASDEKTESTTLLSPVEVTEAPEGATGLKPEAQRIQSLNRQQIENKQTEVLTDLLDNEKGLDTQTTCAFCGAKRVSINGLKNEHSTILIDGLPLYSSLTSIYGLNALPAFFIETVDIQRGSGAALQSPEAIGGAVLISTRQSFDDSFKYQITHEDNGNHDLSLLRAFHLTPQTSALLGVHTAALNSADLDQNKISEFPEQKVSSFFGKVRYQENAETDWVLRYSQSELVTIGGSTEHTHLYGVAARQPESSDFANGDVRNPFLGPNVSITDNIQILRRDFAIDRQQQISDLAILKTRIGWAEQNQRSIYSHGYDLDSIERIYAANSEYQWSSSETSYSSAGIDYKNQSLNSDSVTLYKKNKFLKDDYVQHNIGAYLQQTWSLNQNDEINLVGRLDHLAIDWHNIRKRIDTTLFLPRLFARFHHGPAWSSRWALGRGSHLPSSLYAIQHGTNHNGITNHISTPEIADSLVYSLAQATETAHLEWSTHWTLLKNMAYGVDSPNKPITFINTSDEYLINVSDFSWSQQMTPQWTTEISLEKYFYPSAYKSKLPVAGLDSRAILNATWVRGPLSISPSLIITGARNLAEYGYARHYNIAKMDNEVTSPTFGQAVYAEQKRQSAPTFATMDLSASYHQSAKIQFDIGIKNIFDYTQVSAGDSSTTWDQHGDHFHLDNFHLWGPLEGRRFFLKASGEF